MGPPPRKKPNKAKQVKTPKPKKDPKPRKPKKGKKSKTAAELSEPTPTPRLGDTDPLEGETPPLRPEGEPTPLGTDTGQVDVRAIPLPPGLAPPPCQPAPPPEPQPQPKPLMHCQGEPRRRQLQGVELHQGERQTHSPSGNLKTRDIPLQADKEVEMGMKALRLVVMEETVGMKGTMVTERTTVTERTMVTERTVATEGTVVMGTVRRATAMGVTAKMETATMTMGMKSPNTVV